MSWFTSSFATGALGVPLIFSTPRVTVSVLQLVAAARARKRAVVLFMCFFCLVINVYKQHNEVHYS